MNVDAFEKGNISWLNSQNELLSQEINLMKNDGCFLSPAMFV